MGAFTNTFGKFHNWSMLNQDNLIASFTVNTILGQLDWTDRYAGLAAYEVYSSTNGGVNVLLTTTANGITSYQDTSCKQNAKVVYSIVPKIGSVYKLKSKASTLSTPLCWKTNQSTLTPVTFTDLNVIEGKTITVNWGDGTSQSYSGNTATVTKNYSATGQYNISITGDVDYIIVLWHNAQAKTYGVITNWILPSSLATLAIFSTGLTGSLTNWVFPAGLTYFNIASTSLTGVVTNWILPSMLATFSLGATSLTGEVTNWVLPGSLTYFTFNSTAITGVISNWIIPAGITTFNVASTGVSGSLPQITASASALSYSANAASLSDSNASVFRKNMTVFNVSSQKVAFSTTNVNKVLKALADFYQLNAPTANCTINISGANMGIPTGGASNADLTRLVGYYTAVSKSCTVLVRTS